jgi:hypothetical protein
MLGCRRASGCLVGPLTPALPLGQEGRHRARANSGFRSGPARELERDGGELALLAFAEVALDNTTLWHVRTIRRANRVSGRAAQSCAATPMQVFLATRIWPRPARLIRRLLQLEARHRDCRSDPRGRRARAGFIAADLDGRGCSPVPIPDGDEEHRNGVIMRGMRAGTSRAPVPSQRRRRASRQRRVAFVRSVPPSHRFGPCICLEPVLFELVAGLHSQLAKHLAEVVVDGAGADKQPRGDFLIRSTLGREARDLCFLGGQVIARLDAPFARMLSGCLELDSRTLGEPLHAELRE